MQRGILKTVAACGIKKGEKEGGGAKTKYQTVCKLKKWVKWCGGGIKCVAIT